jgi:hypothetical protein
MVDHLENGTPLPEYSPAFAWGVDGAKQASPNHMAEAWGSELLRSALALRDKQPGEAERFKRARQVLLDAYFPREFGEGPDGVGLWATETMCPDAHGGQHLSGLMLCHLGAVVSKDSELLSLTNRLVRQSCAALLCFATPDLEVWSCGCRAPREPASSAATAWLREMLGEPQGGDLVKNPKAILDPFYLATRIARHLGSGMLKKQDIQAEPCTLKYPVTVHRFKEGHISIMTAPPSKRPPSPVCDWCQVIYGKAGRAAVTFGTDWKEAPPNVPEGAQVIRFKQGGTSRPATTGPRPGREQGATPG